MKTGPRVGSGIVIDEFCWDWLRKRLIAKFDDDRTLRSLYLLPAGSKVGHA
jgi:hypothetical protein